LAGSLLTDRLEGCPDQGLVKKIRWQAYEIVNKVNCLQWAFCRIGTELAEMKSVRLKKAAFYINQQQIKNFHFEKHNFAKH